VKNWEGTLPFTGNYTIQLRPVQGVADSAYTLALTLAPSPSASPSASPSPSPKYDQQKINVPAGKSVDVSGKTSPQRIKQYLVTVPQGQALTVKPVETDVRINVHYPDGTVQQNAAGVNFVRSGNYKVDVIAGDEANFKLNISLQNVEPTTTPTTTPTTIPTTTPTATPTTTPSTTP
jgi:serine/threonine-protein kinase